MRRVIALLLLFALAACTGTGTSGVSATAPGSGFVPGARAAMTTDRKHRKRTNAVVHIVIPRRHPRRRHGRGPDYVSPSTRGIKIVATWQGGSTSTFVETTVAALGPKAPDCTASSSGFSCLIPSTVWEGPNKIDVTVYDKPPSGSSSGATFPSNAQELGFSSITQTVTAGVTPSILIYLGGEIGSINAKPLFSSVPADGSSHDIAIAFNVKDFGGNKITAGSNDPFANPVNVTLTETGGSGHAVLLLNGSGSGSNAKIKFSNDTLGVRYDGGGKSGYTIQVQLAANGAPAETLQVSPLIVEGPGIAAHALGLNGTAIANALTVTEKSAPASQTYNVTRSGCTGIATISGFSGSGAAASFTATGGATGSASGCSISVADGSSTTLVLPVTNTAIAGGVTINGVRITEYSIGASPGPMAVGPDNNLYVVGNYSSGSGGNEILPFKPASGAPTMGTAIPVGGFALLNDVATASDGALWVIDEGIVGVDRITPSGTITKFPSPNSNMDCTGGITAGNDGNVWAPSCSALIEITVGGGFTIVPTAASSPAEIVQGPDGALYFADGTNIDRYDPNTTNFTQIAEPNGATVAYLTSAPNDGASGAVWYTARNFSTTTISYVGRLDVGTQTVTRTTQFGSIATSDVINSIATGADSAVWFTDSTNNQVDRLPVANGSVVETFPLPTGASNPTFVIRGPDGSMWLSESAVGNVVHVIP
ncbi:MAG TPA: hypothetical protein VGG89_00810 [Candidatus Baltobacteraceae bacterium]|jgi:streptogramin lyase